MQDHPSALNVAQVLPWVTPWHYQFLLMVLQAKFYLPATPVESDTALLLTSPLYGLLEFLWWSRKYRLTPLGVAVVAALTHARR